MNNTLIIDVREDLRAGRQPFSRIMEAAAALEVREQLLVIAPFEPVPLFELLEKQGFQHISTPVAHGDWEVRFTRRSNPSPASTSPRGVSPASSRESEFSQVNRIEVDARGLEPPQPMIRILETLAAMPDGAELQARTDRRPMHLYGQLADRGFTAETKEQPDGSFLTYVRRH